MTVTFLSEPYPIVTPSTDSSYVDIDLSSYLPSGATGVLLEVRWYNNSPTLGWRKNGSTDAGTWWIYGNAALVASFGVDASRIIEFYTSDHANTVVRVFGYYTIDSYFLTNVVSYTPTTGSWQDVDISSQVQQGDVAVLGHFRMNNTSDNMICGMRMNGSTDDRHSYNNIQYVMVMSVGLDANQICEAYRADSSTTIYLHGYTKKYGATVYTNCTSYSNTSNSTWQDLSALPSGAVGGFFDVVNNYSVYYHFGMRINGGSDNVTDIYTDSDCHQFYAMKCDANRVIEANSGNYSHITYWLTAIAIVYEVDATVTMPYPNMCSTGTSPPSVNFQLDMPYRGVSVTKASITPQFSIDMPYKELGSIAFFDTITTEFYLSMPYKGCSIAKATIEPQHYLDMPYKGFSINRLVPTPEFKLTMPYNGVSIQGGDVVEPQFYLSMPYKGFSIDESPTAVRFTIGMATGEIVADALLPVMWLGMPVAAFGSLAATQVTPQFSITMPTAEMAADVASLLVSFTITMPTSGFDIDAVMPTPTFWFDMAVPHMVINRAAIQTGHVPWWVYYSVWPSLEYHHKVRHPSIITQPLDRLLSYGNMPLVKRDLSSGTVPTERDLAALKPEDVKKYGEYMAALRKKKAKDEELNKES